MRIRGIFRVVFSILLLLACRPLVAASASVTLAWNPSLDPSVAGYRLYIGVVSQNYPTSLDVGNNTNASVLNLTPGATYYFAVTAYDTNRLESVFSGEISYTVPNATLANLKLALTANRQALLSGHGPGGYTYAVLFSTDLASWSTLGSVTMDPSGNCQFTDPLSPAGKVRFYRLRQISP